MLALEQAGFHRSLIQWSSLRREPGPAEPKGLLGWLRQGGALGDTMYRADNVSLMDGTAAGATIFALLGLVYGSVWPMGPIAGGTLGVLVGGSVGWLLDQLVRERRSRGSAAQRLAGAGCLLLVHCADEIRAAAAEDGLRLAQAVLIGRVE